MPGDNLEDRTNGVADQSESNGLFSTELVTKSKSKYSTKKGSKLNHINIPPGGRLWKEDELTEKQLDVMPEIFDSFVCGKCFLKSAEIKTPEKTPWS
jgi:hypothetical protein